MNQIIKLKSSEAKALRQVWGGEQPAPNLFDRLVALELISKSCEVTPAGAVVLGLLVDLDRARDSSNKWRRLCAMLNSIRLLERELVLEKNEHARALEAKDVAACSKAWNRILETENAIESAKRAYRKAGGKL